MFPSAKKKPDMTLILGLGKKPSRDEGPPPFGGKKEEAPAPLVDDSKGEVSGDIRPEAVSYRDSSQTCQSCEYFGEDGNCSMLKMPVEPDAGCNLHTEKAQGEAPEGALDEEEQIA